MRMCLVTIQFVFAVHGSGNFQGGADCQCKGRTRDRKIQIGMLIEHAIIGIAVACRVLDPYAGLTHGLQSLNKDCKDSGDGIGAYFEPM